MMPKRPLRHCCRAALRLTRRSTSVTGESSLRTGIQATRRRARISERRAPGNASPVRKPCKGRWNLSQVQETARRAREASSSTAGSGTRTRARSRSAAVSGASANASSCARYPHMSFTWSPETPCTGRPRRARAAVAAESCLYGSARMPQQLETRAASSGLPRPCTSTCPLAVVRPARSRRVGLDPPPTCHRSSAQGACTRASSSAPETARNVVSLPRVGRSLLEHIPGAALQLSTGSIREITGSARALVPSSSLGIRSFEDPERPRLRE